jgi:hypothetical protein
MVAATEAEAEAVKKCLGDLACEIGDEGDTFVIYAVSFAPMDLNLPDHWTHTRWREIENRGFTCRIYKFSE